MARPGNRIPSVTLYADKKEVKSAFDIATKSWICYTCKKPFSLLESMGALACSQHPGFIQEDGVWSCCGAKLNPARWTTNYPVVRMFDSGNQCHETIVRVGGCQKCDHKTSGDPYTHKDAHPIADLSALLPFLNKEFPFILRKGFQNGLLRRCATRSIVVPSNAVSVIYQDNDGNKMEWNEDEEIPEGIEISATDDENNEIQIWWPKLE
jgi:hypothetical protein